MSLNEIYENYGSKAAYQTQYKVFFEDADGYPNRQAFEHFSQTISEEEKEYYLACLCIDLHYANNVNYAFGSYVLRKFISGITSSVKNCYMFRIAGDKFNALIAKDNADEFKEYIKNGAQQCEVFCGIVEEKFVPEKSFELIQKGIILMYRDRTEKNAAKKEKNNTIYGSKGNTPPELQETKTKKFRKTMWYSEIDLTVDAFSYKQTKVYVYPTRLAHTLESVPLIVVVDDFAEYRLFYGRDITFGVAGVMFSVTARFTREGNFSVSLYKAENDGKNNCEIKINTTEGVCLPANFGKRIGKDEIFPIRRNATNFCDYVLLKDVDMDTDHKPEIITSGLVSIDGKEYGVSLSDEYIDLVDLKK